MEKHRSNIPNPEELMRFAKGKKFLTKLDLTSGYHQFRISKASRKYTAFVTETGMHQFKRIPFGLHTAPGFFQKIIDQIISGCNNTRGYFDDILIVADTMEEMTENLEKVFEKLIQFNIKIKAKKCVIGAENIEFLGMNLSGNGIRILDSRKKIIQDWEFPKNVKQAAQFIGYVGFVTKFLPNSATIMAPLSDLKSGQPKKKQRRGTASKEVIETPVLRKAFEDIKKVVEEAKDLHFPDFKRQMYLKTDASKIGMGGYLYQVDDDKKELPIAYFSNKFNKTQLKWSIYEKEAFGVFTGIMKFAIYLKGRPFYLLTDHSNLQYIKHNSAPKVVRWFLRLQEFEFKLKHIPRTENQVADALAGAADIGQANIGSIKVQEKAKYRDLSKPLKQALKAAHGTMYGHMGVQKTLARAKMLNKETLVTKEHVQEFIKLCATCQKMDPSEKKVGISRLVALSNSIPWNTVAMDYLYIGDPLDEDIENAILVFIDQCTRKVVLYPTNGQNATQATDALVNLFCNHGPVEVIKSDNAQHFMANVIKQFNTLTGTEHIKSIPNRSQSNGICERGNKEVLRHVQAICHDSDFAAGDWPRLVPLIQKIINATRSSVTGYTPDEMIRGRDNCVHAGVFAPIEDIDGKQMVNLGIEMKMIYEAQQKFLKASKEYQAGKQRGDIPEIKTTQFPVKSLVLALYPHGHVPNKQNTKWEGPFTVVKQEGSVVTICNCHSKKEVMRHVSRVKEFNYDNGVDDVKGLALIASRDKHEFIVESITEHIGELTNYKCKDNRYLVQWKGYEKDEATWEPYLHVADCEALTVYLEKNEVRDHVAVKDQRILRRSMRTKKEDRKP
jgi:hypothetical protein